MCYEKVYKLGFLFAVVEAQILVRAAFDPFKRCTLGEPRRAGKERRKAF